MDQLIFTDTPAKVRNWQKRSSGGSMEKKHLWSGSVPLVRKHDRGMEVNRKTVRRWISRFGQEQLFQLLR